MILLSVFGGGLFIIPLLTIIGAVIFGYQAYVAHNSGYTEQIVERDNKGNYVTKTVEGDEKVAYTSIGSFWFSVILTVATVVIILMMIADK